MAEDRPVVKAIEKMDDETLLKHVNARHAGMFGLGKFGKSNVPGDEGENLLRRMHDRHHSTYSPTTKGGPNHDHGEA